MDYDFRNRSGSGYSGGSAFYPAVGQPAGTPPSRPAPHLHQTTSSSSASPALGIKVAIKPEFRITPPPQLAPQMVDIPRSTFQFDFDFEKRILAEAEKESQNWSKVVVESQASKSATSSLSSPSVRTSMGDPIVEKYVASGLSREAVPVAIQNYGDNPAKVREFVKGYNLLREMGFSSKNVSEALAMYDNDTDKALAYLLNSTS